MADVPTPAGSRPSAAAESVDAVVDGPLCEGGEAAWRVGYDVTPSAPDPASARATRLEARLAVYAQYAAVVAEAAEAAITGQDERCEALRATRDAAAEHFGELRGTLLAESAACTPLFADALSDALHELRHQDAIDDTLTRRLRALHEVAAARTLTPALAAGRASAQRLDVRF